METDYAYDSGDNGKNDKLIQRIYNINSTLSVFKRQLYLERKQLNQEKKEIKQNGWSYPENEYYRYAAEPRPTSTLPEPTVPINKEQLKEIKIRCDEELEKLNDYILAVNELRNNWIKLREAEMAKSRSTEYIDRNDCMENIFFEKKYPRGKIFYVDSDLY